MPRTACVCVLALFHYKANKKSFTGLAGPNKTYTASHILKAESRRALLPEVVCQGSKRPLHAPSPHWELECSQRPAHTARPMGTPASNNILLYLRTASFILKDPKALYIIYTQKPLH